MKAVLSRIKEQNKIVELTPRGVAGVSTDRKSA
jgi:hypothetical protein